MAKKIVSGGSPTGKESKLRSEFIKKFKDCPIPENELLLNLGLFIKSKDLKRILFMNELYKQILNTNGVVIEFGSRWGQNLALFESFRAIYEPFNLGRKIIGFDTFAGFKAVNKNDIKIKRHSQGDYSVTNNYEKYLEEILNYHELENPISHIKKFQIIKGDALKMVKKYLTDNPETIIALAYFDMDLYKPTRDCLNIIKKYITKGTIIGFDELNASSFPGETKALKEVLGLRKYKIHRNLYSSRESFLIVE